MEICHIDVFYQDFLDIGDFGNLVVLVFSLLCLVSVYERTWFGEKEPLKKNPSKWGCVTLFRLLDT